LCNAVRQACGNRAPIADGVTHDSPFGLASEPKSLVMIVSKTVINIVVNSGQIE
jgi:hypothetical protein